MTTEAAPQGLVMLPQPASDRQSAIAQCATLGGITHLCSIEDTLASWIVDGVDYGYQLFSSRPNVLWAFTSTVNNATGLSYLVDSTISVYGVAPVFKIDQRSVLNPKNPAPAFPLCCGEFIGGLSSTGSAGGTTGQPWVPRIPVEPPLVIHTYPGPPPPPQQDHCVLTPVMWSVLYNTELFDVRNSSVAPASMLPLGQDLLSQRLLNTDWLMYWDTNTDASGAAIAQTPPPSEGVGGPSGGPTPIDDGGDGGLTIDGPPPTTGGLLRFKQHKQQAHNRHLLSTESSSRMQHQLTQGDFEFQDSFLYTYSTEADIQFYDMYNVNSGFIWIDSSRSAMCARFTSFSMTSTVTNKLVFSGPTKVVFDAQSRDISQSGLYLSILPVVQSEPLLIGCEPGPLCQVRSGLASKAWHVSSISFPVSTTDVITVTIDFLTTGNGIQITYTNQAQVVLGTDTRLLDNPTETSLFIQPDGTFFPYQIGFQFSGLQATPTGSPGNYLSNCVNSLDITCLSKDCVAKCLPGSSFFPTAAPQYTCQLCSAGKYSPTGDENSCQDCPVGTYSDTDGASVCSPCPSITTTGAALCPEAAVTNQFQTFPWATGGSASAVSGLSMNGDTNFEFFVDNTNDNLNAVNTFMELDSHTTTHAHRVQDEEHLTEGQKQSRFLARRARLAQRSHQQRTTHTHRHKLPINANGVAIGLTSRDVASVGSDRAFDVLGIDYGFVLRQGLVAIVEDGALVNPPVVMDARAAVAFRIERVGVTINYYMLGPGASGTFLLETEGQFTTSQLTQSTKIFTSRRAARSCRYWAAVNFESDAPMFSGFGAGFHTAAGDRGDASVNGGGPVIIGNVGGNPGFMQVNSHSHHHAKQSLPAVQTPILGAHFYKDDCPTDAAMKLTCDDTYMSNDVLYWTTSFCSSMLVDCATGCNKSITGTDRYTGDSHICTAARHALGQDGGQVVFSAMSGFDRFVASFQHGIQSEEWLRKFPVTYRVSDPDDSWDTGGYCGQVDPPANAVPKDDAGNPLSCAWRNSFHTCTFECRIGYVAPPRQGVGMMCLNGVWQQPYASCELQDPTGRVGCFWSDNADQQSLAAYQNDFVSVGIGHSIESCWLQALDANATHFGIRDANECMIGTEYGQYGFNLNGCKQQCTAFPEEECGDATSVLVYDTIVYRPPPRRRTKRYLGCFQKTDSMTFIGPGYTVWSCAYQGLLRGFNTTSYFGLIHGTDCYLGDGVYTDLTPSDESNCMDECRAYPYPHYPEFRCGGDDTLSVYAIVSFIRVLDIDRNNDFNYDAHPPLQSPTSSDNIWTDATTSGVFNGNIKHPEFNTVPFSVIRLCVNDTGKCVVYQHNKVFENAVDLFSSGYIPMNLEDTSNFAQIWPFSACTAIAPGFNVLCPGPYNTRWGFCGTYHAYDCPEQSFTESTAASSSSLPNLAMPSLPSLSIPVVLAEQKSSSSSSSSHTSSHSMVTSLPAVNSMIASQFPTAQHAHHAHTRVVSPNDRFTPATSASVAATSSRHLLSVVDNKFDAMKRKRYSQANSPSPSLLETREVKHDVHATRDINQISYNVDSAQSVIGIGLDVIDNTGSFGAGYSVSFRGVEMPIQQVTPPFAAYLDVIEEADWTLVMEFGNDGFFHYDSPYWTNTDVYPLNQDGTMQDSHGNAKYDSFNSFKFSQMRLCVGFRQTNCIHASFSQPFDNVAALFGGAYLNEGVSSKEFIDVFDPWSKPTCQPVFAGVNVVCPTWVDDQSQQSNNAVRWGFCANRPQANINCALDNNNADAVIGMGLRARSDCCSAGAGYTNLFVYDKPNPIQPLSDSDMDVQLFPQFHKGNYTGHESAERAWLYIRPISPFPGIF